MNAKTSIFTTAQHVSSVFMILALLWLTVSMPYVYAAQKAGKAIAQQVGSAEEDNNPFSNTTEEKNENGVNTLSEYLHDMHQLDHAGVLITQFYKCHPSDLYFAFHPELISPPPEV